MTLRTAWMILQANPTRSMRAAPTIQQRPDRKLLSKPEYGPFLCQGRLERVHLRKNQEMDLEEHPVKYYNQFMDRRGRRLIGVHKQAYAPPEKDAPQGSKILAGELPVCQAQKASH